MQAKALHTLSGGVLGSSPREETHVQNRSKKSVSGRCLVDKALNRAFFLGGGGEDKRPLYNSYLQASSGRGSYSFRELAKHLCLELADFCMVEEFWATCDWIWGPFLKENPLR